MLEIGDPTYTRQFGEDRVLRSDVLLAEPGHPGQALVGDLATGQGIPESRLDCIILTQTLPFIYDMVSAVGNTYRALRPGGVLLATLPGISQISRYDMDRWGDYWRSPMLRARRLFAGIFDPQRAWRWKYTATSWPPLHSCTGWLSPR